jgi:hypothetical protein
MIDFTEVEKSVRNLNQQLNQGEIDEQTLEECLLDMIDMAEDGYYWMFGHETERWYRHDGEKWVLDYPGEMFVPLSDINEAESNMQTKWQSVNLGWFIVSLIVIVIIGGIVYFSV